jgi:regulatory protein RepA
MSLKPAGDLDFGADSDPNVGEFAVSTMSPADLQNQLLSTPVPAATAGTGVAAPAQAYQLPAALDWSAIAKGYLPIDFVFPGLTAGGLGMLAAPGGTGKSYMLLALAASVATGRALLSDWPDSEPAKVLIFFAEDPPDIVHNRLRHLYQSPWFTDADRALLQENMVVRPLVGEDCIVTHKPQFEQKWYRSQFAQAIEEEATTYKARLILLDPLRQFHTMDENDSGEMTELLKLLHGVAFRSKASIVFAHHTNKNATFQGAGDAQQAARGSSAITDNIRWQGNMVLMSEEEAKNFGVHSDKRRQFVRLVLSKSNYTQSVGDLWFQRRDGGILQPVTMEQVKLRGDLNFGVPDASSGASALSEDSQSYQPVSNRRARGKTTGGAS